MPREIWREESGRRGSKSGAWVVVREQARRALRLRSAHGIIGGSTVPSVDRGRDSVSEAVSFWPRRFYPLVGAK
jgi:hypothetical protein